MFGIRGFFTVLCLLAAVSAISAQSEKKDEDEVIRVDTQLVDVPLVVTDKTGNPLLNLKQNNFIIYEDGKKQEVSAFSAVAAPFEVALLLDTSGSTRGELPLIRRAAENFIASLRSGDKVSVIAFQSIVADGKSISVPRILTKLTDDRVKLKEALANVTTGNGTPYYDGLVKISDEVFANAPKGEARGRRALVALTDGVDSVSGSDYSEVAEKFGEEGIVNYFLQVDTRDEFEEGLLADCEIGTRFSVAQIRRYYRRFGARSNVEKTLNFCALGDFEKLAVSKALYEIADAEMQNLAKVSGGKVFPVADIGEARTAFKKVSDEIGTKYSLGYYSTNEKRDGTFRKIKIELKGVSPGALIRSREGYTAPDK